MRRQIFTVRFANIAVTAVQDFFALIAASTSRLAICRCEVMQFSDAGDAQAELLSYTFRRTSTGTPTFGSGGTAATPRPLNGFTGARAAVTTARVNDTAQASDASPTTVFAHAFHISAGLLYAPKYGSEDEVDERFTVEAGQRFVVSLDSAPADSLSISGTITFEELGLMG